MSQVTVSLTASEWIAFFSGIIALLAFFATAWQAYLSRKHNHLSSRPIIDIEIHCRHDEILGLVLFNCGPGPAFIDRATATFRKTNYSLHNEPEVKKFSAALRAAGLRARSINLAIIGNDAVIPSGSKLALLTIADSENREAYAKSFDSLSSEIVLRISYKSLYGTLFEANHDTPVVDCA